MLLIDGCVLLWVIIKMNCNCVERDNAMVILDVGWWLWDLGVVWEKVEIDIMLLI